MGAQVSLQNTDQFKLHCNPEGRGLQQQTYCVDQSNCREQIIVSQLQPVKTTKRHCLNTQFVSAHQQDEVPAQMPLGFQIYSQAPSTGLVAPLLSSKIQFAISHLFLNVTRAACVGRSPLSGLADLHSTGLLA